MSDADFGWDYPPGVSGNEPEITGEDVEDYDPPEEEYDNMAESDSEAWEDDAERCPICRELPRVTMHAHLVLHHSWASPGSVFGRIVWHHDIGTMVCDGCGFKAAKTIANGPIEFLPECWVCGITFTNAEI